VKLISLIFAVTTSMLLVVPALGNSRPDIANAVVMVSVRGSAADKTDIIRNGTGFVVGNSRYVLTANHVVEPPPGGWGKTAFGFPDVTIGIWFRDFQTGNMTEVRRAHVHRAAEKQDAALLEFEGRPRQGLSTCPATNAAITGTQLTVAGVPENLESNGVSPPKLDLNIGVLNEQRAEDDGRRRISAETKPGFSGGPVFLVPQQDDWHLVGILKGGQTFGASSQSLFTPLAEIRGLLIAHCPIPCRDESHGVESWDRDEPGPMHLSDWLRGGSSPGAYCGSYRSDEMNAHPGVTITVEHSADADMRFFTGWRDGQPIVREAQYKYSCQLRYRSGPNYKLALSPRCPAPPNPENLPN
jgi:hypothetical protein